jgi:hypothetical protein
MAVTLNDDWWSTIIGLVVFISISICAVFDVSSNTIVQTIWEKNPEDFFAGTYYWINIPVMFVFVVFATVAVQRLFVEKQKPFHIGAVVFNFCLTFFAIILGCQKMMHSNGVGSAMWSIVFGMFFSNVVFRIWHVIR